MKKTKKSTTKMVTSSAVKTAQRGGRPIGSQRRAIIPRHRPMNKRRLS
jgi:hypothetical protein